MLIEKLIQQRELSREEYIQLLNGYDQDSMDRLQKEAVRVRREYYGDKVFVRGLIEFTNFCKNDCYYCGIQASNQKLERYRLTKEEILQCCALGKELGLKTFVLQGGEDPYFTDERIIDVITEIKKEHPDCAVTLSFGERSYESYKRLREAGVDRYLLRHETANEAHYKTLHPSSMSLQRRKECLFQLKELGYQVGAGFMVGSPNQTNACIADDLIFLKELEPQMVGIGPFVPHHDTKFADYEHGNAKKTLFLLSVVRILLPKVLLPSTTALGTIDKNGRERGLQAGANVVMPNLSPIQFRKQYALYDDKICTGQEAAEGIASLKKQIEAIHYEMDTGRGDARDFIKK